MPFLSHWPYIRQTPLTGVLRNDAASLLAANGREETIDHCAAVADISVRLAERFGLNRDTAESAALLHDISGLIKPTDMLEYAVSQGWKLDESEKKHPFLLHQRISAVIAEEVFGITDKVILSAIACHTTLKTDPMEYDMLLFIADKLSWDQEGTPPFYQRVFDALESSLSHASLAYIDFMLENELILTPHAWLTDAKSWLEHTARS